MLTIFPISLLDHELLCVETGKDGQGGYDDALGDGHGVESVY